MAVSHRGWVGWVEQNRSLAAAVALSLTVLVVAAATAATRSGGSESSRLVAGQGGGAGGNQGSVPASPTELSQPTATPTQGPATSTPGAARRTSGAVRSPGGPPTAFVPGLAPAATCTKVAGYRARGLDDNQIKVGQIYTGSPLLDLSPTNEGLQAFANLIANRGVCGRKLIVDARNDNMQPGRHGDLYRDLMDEVFAFVANQSVFDFEPYSRTPPFDPLFTDQGEFVPDVGGLALASNPYSRGQSQWHAGVWGSISPVMRTGREFRYLTDEARAAGAPCRKAAILYVQEPTRASLDQAELGKAAIEESWGGNLGAGNATLYGVGLEVPENAVRLTVQQMIADGMNCLFSWADLKSNIKAVKSLVAEGAWPQDACTRANRNECFRVVYVSFQSYDAQFLQGVGPGARGVTSYIPHLPLNEVTNPALKVYLDALRTVKDAKPSGFSLLGFASGQMFVQAAEACGGAPTRRCVMDQLRRMRDFTAGGLQGAVTPFRTTRVRYSSVDTNYGDFPFKWIFNCWVIVRVKSTEPSIEAFQRIFPSEGFACDDPHVIRGTPV